MAYQPQSSGPWLKGLVASNQPLAQPKGSFPRGSNLVLMERGALTPCDGSGIINWFNGAVQGFSGRMMCEFLYEPTGVNPYYLVLAGAAIGLGAPLAVSATASTGGSLVSGQEYFYKITALDGVGGETTASNEVHATPSGGNLSVTLVWNVVPNAFGYNIYRSTTTGTEVLLTGGGLPVTPGSTTTYIDTGAASPTPTVFNITNANATGTILHPGHIIELQLTTGPLSSQFFGQTGTIAGNTNAGFNISGTFIGNAFGLFPQIQTSANFTHPSSGTGGTLTFGGVAPPIADSTQQTVLFQMPGGTIPVTYTNANIVAYFPASLGMLGQVPSGGTGGAGTTGAGISGAGNSTPSGGVSGLVGPLPQMKQFPNR